MPVLRKAQSVRATPPAPPVGSRRVTAAPASVTSALARRSIAVRGALADHPQQCDVAGERDHFEADGGEDPARVGLERAAQRVAEGVQRAAGEDQHPDQRHREPDRQRSAAREGACVEGREVELGWGVGGEHGFDRVSGCAGWLSAVVSGGGWYGLPHPGARQRRLSEGVGSDCREARTNVISTADMRGRGDTRGRRGASNPTPTQPPLTFAGASALTQLCGSNSRSCVRRRSGTSPSARSPARAATRRCTSPGRPGPPPCSAARSAITPRRCATSSRSASRLGPLA